MIATNATMSCHTYHTHQEKKWVDLFAVVLVFLLSDSLLFATSNIYLLNVLRRILPLFICLVFIFKGRKLNNSVFILSICFFVSMIVNFEVDSFLFYITQIGYLLLAFYLSASIESDRFVRFFLFVLRVVCIVSIVCFFFSKQIASLNFIPTITNSNGRSFKFLLFTNVPIDHNFTNMSRRNWGPFWEPGAFQFYLNIGIILALFSKNKRWFFDFLLFAVTLLTTLSGAAVLSLPFIVLAFFFSKQKTKKHANIIILLLLLSLVIILFSFDNFTEILSKITNSGSEEGSMDYRLGSLIANFRASLQYPLFGAPPAFQKQLRANIIGSLNGVFSSGNVSTISGYFAYFGIPVGLYICYLIFKSTKLVSKTIISRVFLFIAIFVMSSNENFMQSTLMCLIIVGGMIVDKSKLNLKNFYPEDKCHDVIEKTL